MQISFIQGFIKSISLRLILTNFVCRFSCHVDLFVKLTHVRLQRPRFKEETDYRHHFIFMQNFNQSFNFLKQSFPFVMSDESKPIKFIVTFN